MCVRSCTSNSIRKGARQKLSGKTTAKAKKTLAKEKTTAKAKVDDDSDDEGATFLNEKFMDNPPHGAGKGKLKAFQVFRKKQVMRYRKHCELERNKLLKSLQSCLEPFLKEKAKIRKVFEDSSVVASLPNQNVYLQNSPSYLNGTLRDYQLEGVNWIIDKFMSGVGCILGDEMGLGKTVQTLTFLAYLKHERRLSGPNLVIVPLAVAQNWINELKKFTPSLTFVKVQGSLRFSAYFIDWLASFCYRYFYNIQEAWVKEMIS